jgi:predicted metal-dependent peptidase
MRQVTKLDRAKAQIVMDYPFFSSILFKRGLQEDRTIPTLAVPLKGAIKYNPEFIEGLPVPQIVWGLCHEVGHVIAQHAIRRKHRDPKKWNYAGDAWINDMLDDCKVGERIPDCVDMPGSKDKTTETSMTSYLMVMMAVEVVEGVAVISSTMVWEMMLSTVTS